MKVVLAGEGETELGAFVRHVAYRPKPGEPEALGVLEALLRKRVGARAYEIHDAVPWRSIRKYRAGDHASAEARNVVGLALRARDVGADLLVFTRDQDRDPDRKADVDDGIRRAHSLLPQLRIVGAMAIEEIEAWVLLALGDARAESYRDPKAKLRERHGIATTEAMVAAIQAADLEAVDDKSTLSEWLAGIRDAFPRPKKKRRR